MALNASIFGNMLNAPKSPEEYAAERENLLAARQANVLNKQKADEYTKGVERQGQLRNLLAGGADSSALRKAGFLGEAADWDKNAAIVAKDKAAAAKDTNDANLKTWQAYRDQSSMIRSPQEAAAWITRGYNDPVIGPFLQRFGSLEEGVSRIPTDPAGFEQWRMGVGSNVDKMASHALQQQEFGLKQNQFGETVRHNKSTEGIQIRGQNLVDERAKEGNTLKAAEIQAGGKPPPGYRWNPDGSLSAIPGGPGDKLPESQQKQVVGVQNLSNAIQEYRQALKSFGSLDALKPDQRAMMGTKYNNMMLQAKEAYNLGVLNGPDFDILQSVVTDPRSLKGVITSNKALDTQASELDRIMSGVAQTSSQLKPRGGATQPSNQGPKAGDVDGGYRFKGGDPSNPSNWEKVK